MDLGLFAESAYWAVYTVSEVIAAVNTALQWLESQNVDRIRLLQVNILLEIAKKKKQKL